MSTRSGKRLHGSFRENIDIAVESGIAFKSEKKTRNKKPKVNDNSDIILSKTKKRNNYVSYPKDNENLVDALKADVTEPKNGRRQRRNTLKEHNSEPVLKTFNTSIIKVSRLTRRNNKFTENISEICASKPPTDTEIKVKSKKSKKKSKNGKQSNEAENLSKKSRKKKKSKRSSEFIVEDCRNNTSNDSFHSAAGSPLNKNKQSPEITHLQKDEVKLVDNLVTGTRRQRSSMINSPFVIKFAGTDVKDLHVDSIEKLNTTYEKDCTVSKSQLSNNVDDSLVGLNATFDKITDIKDIANTVEDSATHTGNLGKTSETLNATFDKIPKQNNATSLNSTYDKNEPKLDITFDKASKSSLMSTDNAVNITFDKSNDNSRISITSDDSKTGHIVNTTPLLIESSIDESHISGTPKNSTNSYVVSPKGNDLQPPALLKREGTFTKNGPDVIIMSPKPKIFQEKTPTKRMSLPSPGLTSFHITRSSQRDKSMMNITQSIEKLRRSSIDVAPRQTRVMFCSPVNNPAMLLQQKRKVIKSSMKGSNKSFVFEENGPKASRPMARKRSLTHNDAEDARVKRKRLADDLQQSVDRLSRPRTSSATAKLSEYTPSKQTTKPSKAKPDATFSRKKLPNFSTLHQKQFDKMESLDECQERKAKRARQLMTPNGGTVVLERSSPRGTTTDQQKTKDGITTKKVIKNPETPSKKAETPKKQFTLESLRPGYTRFGFKMHVEGNPFSVTSKPQNKANEFKPNGLTKEPSQLSLAGIRRKETAKQAVMKEKSFTALSRKNNINRNEDRTIIKGVRTNRRFELQMQLRNIN